MLAENQAGLNDVPAELYPTKANVKIPNVNTRW